MDKVKSWWHPTTVKSSDVRNAWKMVLLGSIALEVVAYFFLLWRAIESLYEYNRAGEKILTTAIAIPYSDLALSSFFRYLCGMLLLLLTILPGIFFYQHYIGTKSIYTMLRLREKKLHIRFYIENMAVSVVGIWGIILWHLILYCLGYLIYLALVPSTNLPEGGFRTIFQNNLFQHMVPVLKPYLWFVPICIGILLPGITQLLVLAERSKRKGFVAAFIGVLGLISLYTCYIGVSGYPFYIIFATVAVVGTGLFYMNYVEIV